MDSDGVAIFGLGYVGCVSLAGLAASGIRTTGVDVDADKVDGINRGYGSIVEPKLDDLLASGLANNLVSATTDAAKALANSNIAMITVGTPRLPSGELDLSQIFNVCTLIGKFLESNPKKMTIAIRSTIKPGTCEKIAELVARVSGLVESKDFFVVANPEFLREGTAIDDYLSPPYVVIGGPDSLGRNNVASLYKQLKAEIKYVNYKTAETIKYINNSWHAVKVAFGNEIGSICKSASLDTDEIMDLFFSDRVLNISPYYLKPGFPYGGACLPKDLSGLVAIAREHGISVPLLEGTSHSNDSHISRAVQLTKSIAKNNRVSFLGLSFKSATDDVRNSPSVTIIKSLIADGYDVKIYDSDVLHSIQSGKNIKLIRSILSKLEDYLINDVQELLEFSDCVVIAKSEAKVLTQLATTHNKVFVDLVGSKVDLSKAGRLFSLVK